MTNDDRAVILPLYAVSDGAAQRGRGRPHKVEKRPEKDDLIYHQQISRQRAEAIDVDRVVRAVRDGKAPEEILGVVAEELAKEAAILDFDRQEAQKRGRDTSQICSRRATLLAKLTELQRQLAQFRGELLDPWSPQFQKAVGVLVEDVLGAARGTLEGAQLDTFLNRLEVVFADFEERVEAAVR